MPDLAAIRHVHARDIILNAPFFVAQTRPVLPANDLSPVLLEDGNRRVGELVRNVLGDVPEEVPAPIVF